MSKLDHMEDDLFVFGSLLVTSNRMDTLLERELKEFNITSKQWFLCVVIDNLFSEPPTIKEVAKETGSSHQNVKQVALKLEQKGLLKLIRDEKDARVTRLSLTDYSKSFWSKTAPKGVAFTHALFDGIDADELEKTRKLLEKMLFNLSKMENKK